MMRIIGLDMSIACSGVAIVQAHADGKLEWSVKRVKSPPTEKCDAMRFHLICEEISDIICLRPTDIIMIEEYAYGANGQITRIAELGGILRYKLLIEQKFDYEQFVQVSPSALKKFVTGKGNVKKEQVMKEVFKRWGFDAEDNNEADAFALAVMGGTAAVAEIINPPKHQREAIAAVFKRNEVLNERFLQLVQAEGCGPVAPSGPRPRRTPQAPPALAAHHAAANAPGGPRRRPNAPAHTPASIPDAAALFARRRPQGE